MKIEKLKNSAGVKFYPVTIPEAIANEETNELLPVTLAKKAEHGYESSPKALKEVDDSVAQLGNDVKNDTEKATADSLSELNARLAALEKIVSSTLTDRIDVTKEFNVWGKTNLIIYGSGASTSAPDFIGQTYIDTAGGNVYIAVGTENAGNWKLV